MDAGPRTLYKYQQQTKLVDSARLHLSVHSEVIYSEGNTNRAGCSRRFKDQQHTSSSENSSSETSTNSSEISSSEDNTSDSENSSNETSNSSSNSAELDRHSSKVEIWSRIDGVRESNNKPQVTRGKANTKTRQSYKSDDDNDEYGSSEFEASEEEVSDDASKESDDLTDWVEDLRRRTDGRQKARARHMDEAIARVTKSQGIEEIDRRSLARQAHALFRGEERERRKELKKERDTEIAKQAALEAEWHGRLETLVPLYRSLVDELSAINQDEAKRREARRVKAQDKWLRRREQLDREVEIAERDKKDSLQRDLLQAQEMSRARWVSGDVTMPARRNVELEALWQDKITVSVASVKWEWSTDEVMVEESPPELILDSDSEGVETPQAVPTLPPLVEDSDIEDDDYNIKTRKVKMVTLATLVEDEDIPTGKRVKKNDNTTAIHFAVDEEIAFVNSARFISEEDDSKYGD